MKASVKLYMLPAREWAIEYRDRMGVKTRVRVTGSQELLKAVYDASKKARPTEFPPLSADEEIDLKPVHTR